MIISQRWLNYLYPLEVKCPIFTIRRPGQANYYNTSSASCYTEGESPEKLVFETDAGYLENLVECEYELQAELAKIEE